MNPATKGMKVVVSTYLESGRLLECTSFRVNDETDIIDEVDDVEHFLFEQYDKFTERGLE